jgi:hyperosmotically inducible periplasmic protein
MILKAGLTRIATHSLQSLILMSDQDEVVTGQSVLRNSLSDLPTIRTVPNETDSFFLLAYGEGVDLLGAHPDSYSLLSSTSKVGIQVNGSSRKFQRLFLPLGSIALSMSLMGTLVPRHQGARHPVPDNTKINEDRTGPTADQQKMNPSDRAITQKIRKAIHHDKSLSTYGGNIKIFTQEGKVTLQGPVRSEEEKGSLEAKAVSVAGQENVSNQLEVLPSR